MPTSNLALIPTIVHLVHTAEPHKTVLDIGPGRGKYGLLIAEALNDPPEVIDAVEVEPSYITPRLRAIYDRVYEADVRRWTYENFYPYDVVLMVDVIEHLTKTEGFELLQRIPGRIVVSTPEHFFDNGPGLPPSEEHRSVWSRQDFEQLRTVEVDESTPGGVVLLLAPLSGH